jgi:hypothetical protein
VAHFSVKLRRPVHLENNVLLLLARHVGKHVAAGFMPAFKFQQGILLALFERGHKASIKPAATSIRKLDSFASNF